MANGKLELYGMTPIRALPITTHNELIALTTISSYQGQNETAFPGLDKLAERSGLSKQAFSKAVTGLVKKNLVNRKRRYGSSNIYFVVWEFADREQIKKENDAERRMSRAKILAKNIQLSESLRYSNDSDVDYKNDSDVSYPKESDDILKEQNKRTELKEQSPFPSQDKVTLFFEHHKKQLMQTRKHGDPDLHLVDKLGTLIEWDIETYDKILKAKQNSTWEVRRNQPNTAKWLLATMENENLETAKSNVVTFPKYDLEELRKEGFV